MLFTNAAIAALAGMNPKGFRKSINLCRYYDVNGVIVSGNRRSRAGRKSARGVENGR